MHSLTSYCCLHEYEMLGILHGSSGFSLAFLPNYSEILTQLYSQGGDYWDSIIATTEPHPWIVNHQKFVNFLSQCWFSTAWRYQNFLGALPPNPLPTGVLPWTPVFGDATLTKLGKCPACASNQHRLVYEYNADLALESRERFCAAHWPSSPESGFVCPTCQKGWATMP